jgi:hypothetical protein
MFVNRVGAEPNGRPVIRKRTLHATTTAVNPLRGLDRPFACIFYGRLFHRHDVHAGNGILLTLIDAAAKLARLNSGDNQTPSGTPFEIEALI